MCGRFGLKADAREIQRAFELESPPEVFAPRYNIAPTQPVLAVVEEDGSRRARHFRWGLIPFWAKDPSIGNRMINARGESVAEKPAYRGAFRSRRCVVPASGFYEWKREAAGKVPHWIAPADGSLLPIAGLWERWEGPEGEVGSLTLLTTTPNALLGPIHDRMPVILDADGVNAWLGARTAASRLQEMLRPAPDGLLLAHPVSTLVNSPANDLPDCIEPLAD